MFYRGQGAIQAAAAFPGLSEEVASARVVQKRWLRNAQTRERLDWAVLAMEKHVSLHLHVAPALVWERKAGWLASLKSTLFFAWGQIGSEK